MKFGKITVGLCALICAAAFSTGCKERSEMPPLDEGSSVTYSSASSSSSSAVSTTDGTSSALGSASQDPIQSTVQGTVKPAQSSAPHAHDYEIKEYVEPTCVKDGHGNYTCKCGDGYITVIEATGHKYSAKTIEPDCVNQGCTRYTCDVCGDSYDENVTNALGHAYGQWKTVKDATTSSEGEKQATCSRCGKTISEAIPRLQPAVSFDDFTSEVVRLVNIERANYGLSPLNENSRLGDFAQTRSQEIIGLFDHTRPNGNRAVNDILALGGLRTCGENIAMGQPTPEAVVDAWMNSEGHRKNILTADFTMIGVGCSFGGGTYYWVQVFGG